MDLNLKKIYLDGLLINYDKNFNIILDNITKNNYLYNEELEEIKNIKNKLDEVFKKINERIKLLIILKDDY